MITDKKPISMAEAKKFLSKENEQEAELLAFINKFVELSPEQAEDFSKKIEELNLMKIRKEHVTKIIDLLPEDAEDLNKIFTDTGLDEDETKKILEIVKEFK